MSATLLSGRPVSSSIIAGLVSRVKALKEKGTVPRLVILRVGADPASISYIRQKRKAAEGCGIESSEVVFAVADTKKIIEQIERLNSDKKVHGILVQLPLPADIQTPLVIRSIDPQKDVDGFHAYNIGKVVLSREFERLAPCTPKGVIILLEHYQIPIAGTHAVVVGRSNIVGKPMAAMLLNRDATVTVCHSKTRHLSSLTLQADILVAAAGHRRMITADMVKPGATVIDVGITNVENKLVGDVDFDSVKDVASAITPVPGGVGPMTVACLMENVVTAAEFLNPNP